MKTQSLNCQGGTEQATGELKRNRKCGGDLNVEVAIGRGRQEVEVWMWKDGGKKRVELYSLENLQHHRAVSDSLRSMESRPLTSASNTIYGLSV